jgi:ornithine cyclodeaminase/alanine dehydrogenase-like protein (mu-crystallin family)
VKTLLLAPRDLRELVDRVGLDRLMDELIEEVMAAFASFDERTMEIPSRSGFSYETPFPGLIEWMPLLEIDASVLMKVVGYHPMSPGLQHLPTILSTFSLYDTATGHLSALVDGTLLTAMRTGAASAVASRLLARPDSATLGLIGCGAQAVTQLHAIGRRFDLRETLFFDVNATACDSLPARAAGIVSESNRLRQTPVEEIVGRADILVVATSVPPGRGPVFEPCQTRPWLHINAVGSDFPGKTELPRTLLNENLVFPDNLAQARCEGECQQLDGNVAPIEIVQIARRPEAFRHVQGQRTVFDSTGWALEDYVAMELVLRHARALGLGSEIEIQCVAEDPHHPYEFLYAPSIAQRS